MTPLYVMTLEEEPWKQQVTIDHLIQQRLFPTILHGFHGMLLGLRPTNPFQFERNGVPEYIHIAQVGCALSHLHMLKVAISSGEDEFILCEDDVEFCPDFIDKWTDLRRTLPDWVGALQLEYLPVHAYYAGAMQPLPLHPVSPGVVRCDGFGHCSACIWWTRIAAQRAVQLLRPIDAPFDILLMRKVYPFVGHALCDPPLAKQRTASGEWPSSIGTAAGKVLPEHVRHLNESV